MPVLAASSYIFVKPYLPVPLILGAVLLSLSVPAYYHAMRPRRGTTEWIRRLEPQQFTPIQVQRLNWTDVFWALLAVVCSAALRLIYHFFFLQLHRMSNAAQIFLSVLRWLLRCTLPNMLLAFALYLLLRTLFGGKPLPALLCGIMAGYTQNAAVTSTALVICSLFCLYVWMSALYDAPLFFNAFWLVGAGLLYAFAMLLCRSIAWLAPCYLAAYLVTQVLRWREGNPQQRGKKLAASLLLTLLALLFGMLLLWLFYCLMSRRMEGTPIDLLGSVRFYQEMLPTFGKKIAALFHGGSPLQGMWIGDSFVCFAGLASLIPLLHGAIRLRDTQCLMILCLLPFCLCAWLLGGTYLLPIPLLLSLGRLWQIYTERGRSAYAVGSFGVITLCFFATTILI